MSADDLDPRVDGPCDVPPAGWECSRKRGHEGPCAAVPTQDERADTIPISAERSLRLYADALRRIRDHGETHDEPCWALHNGDCADVMQEIARAALAEFTEGVAPDERS
jgi:hypothetical protein